MTNGAAIGYALAAGKDIGLTKQQLEALERQMKWIMDNKLTEEEAEEVYRKS
jgi:hypothetical protein